MSLGILKLLFLACIIIGLILAALVIWKPNIFKKPQNFLMLQLFPVIISFIIMTSLPYNYMYGRVMGSVPIVISIISMLMQKKNYKWANYLTIFNIILSIVLLNVI